MRLKRHKITINILKYNSTLNEATAFYLHYHRKTNNKQDRPQILQIYLTKIQNQTIIKLKILTDLELMSLNIGKDRFKLTIPFTIIVWIGEINLNWTSFKKIISQIRNKEKIFRFIKMRVNKIIMRLETLDFRNTNNLLLRSASSLISKFRI